MKCLHEALAWRRRHDAARTIAAFDSTPRTDADLSHVTERLVAVVEETMPPAHVSLWLREPALDAQHHVQPGVAVSALPAGIPSSEHISAGPGLAYQDIQRQLASGWLAYAPLERHVRRAGRPSPLLHHGARRPGHVLIPCILVV
ncbi:MAG TPA: hypothetical protein VF510_13485 [Ktedonobacterales bacterium]